MKKLITRFWGCLHLIVLSVICSCERESLQQGDIIQTCYNARIKGETVDNPYSLRIMQAALDSLLSTKGIANKEIELKPTDYYIRINPTDSLSTQLLSSMDVELFDYPLDCEFEDNAEYYYDPQEPIGQDSEWYYSAVPVEYSTKEIPYKDVLEAQAEGEIIHLELNANIDNKVSCELLDECYVPEHALKTKTGDKLPVSIEELESMAFLIAGVQEEYKTKASSPQNPSGFVYVNDGSKKRPVKGVKIRVQKFINWSTVYTNDAGYFYVCEKYNKPNISIIYSNQKDFIIWGNWLFLAPATYTVTSCTHPNSFTKEFNQKNTYAPWTWAVVNNSAYEYYCNCATNQMLNGVSLPPSKMKLWCLNVDMGNVGGGAPMIKHLVTSRVLSGTTAILSYLTTIRWVKFITTAVAAVINVMGPDILLNTFKQSYSDLYLTTYHELCHASHFSSIGEWNYGKLIWYEMTHPGDATNIYGVGGTGAEGEGYCEVSESFAYSIENFKQYKTSSGPYYWHGNTKAYFFGKYVTVLTNLLINSVIVPGDIFACMTPEMTSMDDLLEQLCLNNPGKKSVIQSEMAKAGL